jgi:HSP20 family protein
LFLTVKLKAMNLLKRSDGNSGSSTSELPTLFNVPSLFNDFFLNDWFTRTSPSEGGSLPAVNVKETNEAYELEVAAPGLTRDDFKVEMNNDRLIISGEKKLENKEGREGSDYVRKEFSYQSFMRSFSLPEAMVDSNRISAKYHDGILHILVPKTENAKPRMKKIQVS